MFHFRFSFLFKGVTVDFEVVSKNLSEYFRGVFRVGELENDLHFSLRSTGPEVVKFCGH